MRSWARGGVGVITTLLALTVILGSLICPKWGIVGKICPKRGIVGKVLAGAGLINTLLALLAVSVLVDPADVQSGRESWM
ncbi:hypothetical protein T484DRAFT_1866157 [Baffinella frigidus]|nr:hypothetical protein T484DRAFT_1866157 [Cryptophyta sp. CCMP2293]